MTTTTSTRPGPSPASTGTGIGPTTTARTWRIAFVVGGLLTFVGGSLHPDGAPDGTYEESLGTMLADGKWTAGHLVFSVGMAALLVGLAVRFLATPRGDRLRRLLGFAVVAAAVSTVEMVFHTAAVVDKDAFAQSDSTPILSTHLGLAVVAQPLLGLAVILLAIALVRGRHPVLWVVTALVVAGSLAWAAAAPLVVLGEDPSLSALFTGFIAISLWALAHGIAGERRPAV